MDPILKVGDYVDARWSVPNGKEYPWFPGTIIGIKPNKGHYIVRFEEDDEIYELLAKHVRKSTDYDFPKHVRFLPLSVGDKVEARWRHADGNKKWYKGTVMNIHPNGKCAILYDDGDFEPFVLRKNIRGKEVTADGWKYDWAGGGR
mmetsp:Transcript_31321/g.100480  ORF Transcript_31321/g.100480 Transcript_31321/m.100480 type:complete len:146 (-) Transcript_31321:1270-1707(-)